MSLGARRRRPPTPRFVANELWRRAGEVPSFHIAPARTRNATDLITGNPLGSYNSASPAWAVGPDGVLFLPAANAPVIEYDPVTLQCLGARIWGVGANLRPYSERILATPDVADYSTTNATLVQQTTATPIQGLNVASKLTLANGANTGNNLDGMTYGYSITLASNTIYTQSIFVKAAGSSVLRLRSNVSGQVFTIPIAGPEPTPTGNISACTVKVFPNGWSRISWTFTTTTGAPGARVDHWTLKTDIANGTDGILMTGAMIQTGSTLGPYVPTTTTSASSTADVWSITGADFSRIFNPTELTIYAEATSQSSADSTIWQIDDNSGNVNRFTQYFASNILRSRTTISNSQNDIDRTGVAVGVPARGAYGIKASDYAAVLNGGTIGTSAHALPSATMSILRIGSVHPGGAVMLNGYIRELAIFRSRRPNTNLQAMTS